MPRAQTAPRAILTRFDAPNETPFALIAQDDQHGNANGFSFRLEILSRVPEVLALAFADGRAYFQSHEDFCASVGFG